MSKHLIKRTARYAGLFKALSNPNRLRIFMRLVSCCSSGKASCSMQNIRSHVGAIGSGLGVAPSTVSHHIKELNRAGLINMKRSGQHIQCWVEPDVLKELSDFFELP